MKQVLYKKDAFGNILEWNIEIDYTTYFPSSNGDNNIRLKYQYGKLNSINKTISYSNPVSKSKAIRQFESIIERQKKKGYKSLNDIYNIYGYDFGYDGWQGNLEHVLKEKLPKYNTDSDNCIKPMKCTKFKPNVLNYPCVIQPKLNGVRCTIMYQKPSKRELFEESYSCIIKSKEGLVYDIKHILKEFDKLYKDFSEYQSVVFDGELYIHGENVTTIAGASRNSKNPRHKDLIFVCFDLAIEDISNVERDAYRYEILGNMCPLTIYPIKFTEKVVCLISQRCLNDEYAMYKMDEYIKLGYEGAVIRDLDAEYGFGKRVTTMMKLKRFVDEEFEIIDIKAIGTPDDRIGFTIIYTLKNNINDELFEANGIGTVDEKCTIFDNKDKYINKMATVKFYERTINGIPFHANVIGIRDYE